MNLVNALSLTAKYLYNHGWQMGRFYGGMTKCRGEWHPAACLLGALQYVTQGEENRHLYPKACLALRKFLNLEPGISLAKWNDTADCRDEVISALTGCAKSLTIDTLNVDIEAGTVNS